ncbi:DUF3592 domain-containing protein [Flavobacterium beibuense]|uniref:DUF3592 domain containing protein n=1 Tax=Flavobacterium beibuense TaxID=657326 RepID=A0A444WER4_9FLAO|nr:DUF3592 domain-containing protein [Flavobacterium beibuense]RYJ44343.1 DUF3592 domain containing protein [Flavobacterium beibuense]
MFFEQELIFYIGLLCAVSPVVVLISILYFYKVSIKKWKTTEGLILRNTVERDKKDTDGGWRNYVVYEYSVDGKHYQNNDRHTQNLIFSSSSKYQIVPNERFVEGKKVKVFYNPQKPHKSVLDDKFDYYNLAVLFFTIIGILIAYYDWK